MNDFFGTVDRHIKTLELYVPVVARVHGESHPEFHAVKNVYDDIRPRLTHHGSDVADLGDAFAKLRAITANYTVPGDVCESYEAVYKMLEEIDQAYAKQASAESREA